MSTSSRPRSTQTSPSLLGIASGVALAGLATLVAVRRAYAPVIPACKSNRRPVVLITGAAGGLGSALARRYAREHVRLILSGRKLDGIQQTRDALLKENLIQSPDDALLLAADLSNAEDAQSMIERAFGHLERIDVLINVAGVIEVGPVENQPLSAFKNAIESNFYTALHTIHAALPHLLRQEPLHHTGSHRASIVNISSIGGKFAVPHLLPYTASKFALTGFSEGLHAELRSKGIRITTVCPGLMRSGGEGHAKFVGNVGAERRWFMLSAKTPGISANVNTAADDIFRAQRRGAAEITISPQAWLAARISGVAPSFTATASAAVNQLLLPKPVGSQPTQVRSA